MEKEKYPDEVMPLMSFWYKFKSNSVTVQPKWRQILRAFQKMIRGFTNWLNRYLCLIRRGFTGRLYGWNSQGRGVRECELHERGAERQWKPRAKQQQGAVNIFPNFQKLSGFLCLGIFKYTPKNILFDLITIFLTIIH